MFKFTNLIKFAGTISLCLSANTWSNTKSVLDDIGPTKGLNGKSYAIAKDLGKKPIYLKFWASWCIPCREEMPHLEHSFKEYKNDIAIYAVNININERHIAMLNTQKEFNLSVPIIIDENGELARNFNFSGTPYHVLISKEGKIVHTGHRASESLDRKLALLAADNAKELVGTQLDQKQAPISVKASGHQLLYFTASWCDWYLKDLRPDMSANCVNAQEVMKELHTRHKNLPLEGLVTHLWTEEKDLDKYIQDNGITYPIRIDQKDENFFAYGVREFPTLIVLKDGKEVFRTENFSNKKKALSKINLNLKKFKI